MSLTGFHRHLRRRSRSRRYSWAVSARIPYARLSAAMREDGEFGRMQSRQAASRRRSGDLASAKGKDSPAKTRRESSASHGSISCPICGLQLTPAELPAHYEWELNRVEDEPPDVVEEAAKTGIRARRGAAVAAAQQIASVHKGKGPAVAVNQLDDNEMLLYRVKASRLKRAALTLNKPGKMVGMTFADYQESP
ncbi:hypothetical protein BDZ88DRAFT_305728 [Geranomyces variabilis]|nr:hypothetical protein BDZ88DRAFT_305728 [Geranomyces variabilis]